jgi:hypothetical protein
LFKARSVVFAWLLAAQRDLAQPGALGATEWQVQKAQSVAELLRIYEQTNATLRQALADVYQAHAQNSPKLRSNKA